MEEVVKKYVDLKWEDAKSQIAAKEFEPATVFLGPGRKMGILPYRCMSELEKEAFSALTQILAEELNPDAIVVFQEGWCVRYDKVPKGLDKKTAKLYAVADHQKMLTEFGGSLGNVPGRVEVVFLIAVDRYGDKYSKCGEILRTEVGGAERIWVQDTPDLFPKEIGAWEGRMIPRAWATSKGEVVQ